MPARIDISGYTFGRWTAVRFLRKAENRQSIWVVRCECGSESEATASSLRSGATGGCRKCKSQRQERYAYGRLFCHIRKNAEIRGIEFNVSRDYIFLILETQKFTCALSGTPIWVALSARRHMRGGTTASADRIDSDKGYVKGNIQWVHKDVNRMKSVFSMDKFLVLCRMIAEKHPANKPESV